MDNKIIKKRTAVFKFKDGFEMRRFLSEYSDLFTKIIVDEEKRASIIGSYNSNDCVLTKLRKESGIKILSTGGSTFHEVEFKN